MKKFISYLVSLAVILSVVILGNTEEINNPIEGPVFKQEVQQQTPKIKEDPFQSKYSILSKKVVPTVVSIQVNFLDYSYEDGTRVPMSVYGSGVFISSTGHILTCAHLFAKNYITEIIITTYSGDIIIAEALYISKRKDLALLKPYYGLENVKYADVSKRSVVNLGEEVLAIGHPLGLMWTVTNGIVTGVDRIDNTQKVTQINAVINPGNSGGPLFDMEGNVIGINVSMLGTWGIPMFSGQGFAVSIAEINKFLNKFRGI